MGFQWTRTMPLPSKDLTWSKFALLEILIVY